jgi:hypothetical protein
LQRKGEEYNRYMQNNTLTWILGLILVLLLIGGAYYLGTNRAVAPDSAGPNSITNQPPTEPNWEFIDAGEDATGAPQTTVALSHRGQVFNLGTQQGACSEIKDSSWELADGELSGVICWWAGGGIEFGLFMEDGRYVIKQGVLEEGTAEGGGLRGDFKTILSL